MKYISDQVERLRMMIAPVTDLSPKCEPAEEEQTMTKKKVYIYLKETRVNQSADCLGNIIVSN